MDHRSKQVVHGKQTVYILEDNDDAGRSHAAKVAAALHGIVPEIRVVSFPELPDHGDVSDWLEMGGTKDCCLSVLRQRKRHRRAMTTRWSVPPKSTPCNGLVVAWSPLARLLELLTGLPGIGKSQVHCQFVANVTTGRAWPDGTKGIPARSVNHAHGRGLSRSNHYPTLDCGQGKSRPRHILKKIRKDNKDRMFLLAEDVEILRRSLLTLATWA